MWDESPNSAPKAARRGKPKGRHPHQRLTAVLIRSLKQPGRYGDGNGLYLVVDPGGAKRWVQRLMVAGRRRDLGLGGLGVVGLAEAREEARLMRQLARRGVDVVAERIASPTLTTCRFLLEPARTRVTESSSSSPLIRKRSAPLTTMASFFCSSIR